MVIEPPFCRPPVTPLSVPVTEPRPVVDPVPEVLAAPVALPRAGMEPETEFRPGRLLLACVGPLAW